MDSGTNLTHDDIVVTWPKDRAFGSYMIDLERAKTLGLFVNFRVPRLPDPTPERCYRVWDGQVRGYLQVFKCVHRGLGEVERVPSDPLYNTQLHWPPGDYVVCEPFWHEAPHRVEMRGFRGWRWFDRSLTEQVEAVRSMVGG